MIGVIIALLSLDVLVRGNNSVAISVYNYLKKTNPNSPDGRRI